MPINDNEDSAFQSLENYLKNEKKKIETEGEEKDLAQVLKVKTKRPNRETVIQKDEILNLTIALQTSQDVNDFLKQIGCKV